MPKLLIGPALLCLVLWLSGCASSKPMTVPVIVKPDLPAYLTAPLVRPEQELTHNRDLLELLADYEALRRRANADRAALVEILNYGDGDKD